MEKIDRSEHLLALVLLHMMKDEPQRDKILQLNVAGFSNLEIADLLQTTAAVVSQSLYEARQGKGRRSGITKKSSRSRAKR